MIESRRNIPLVFIASILIATQLRAGIVHTLDGKTLQGVILFDKTNSLYVTPKLGPVIHVEPDNLLDAVLADKPSSDLLRCGIILTDSSAIAADEIIRADDTNLVYRAHGADVTIPLGKISRIIFRPIPTKLAQKLLPGQFGALLDNGDLVQGNLKSIAPGSVVVESVIFGISPYSTANQVLAVCLADPQPAAANWIVELTDGTVWPQANLKFDANKLVIEPRSGEPITVDPKSVARIRAGSGRLFALTDQRPQKIDPADASSYSLDSIPMGTPMALTGLTPAHAICCAAGSSITYSLDGKYRALTARVGIPREIAPFVRIRFIVLADGKEVLRSPERTSIDEALVVSVNLGNVKVITLKIESANPMDMGAVGLWADPALIRPIPTTQPVSAP